MKTVIYFSNSTGIPNTGRTSETKLFEKLKDCKAYMENRFGYIIRQENNVNTLIGMVNGFLPSATEQIRLKDILK